MPPSSSDADKAWNEMLGKSGGGSPAKPPSPPPSASQSKTPIEPPAAPASPRASVPIAAAAKWGAVLVLGLVAIFAVVWVVLSNRTRPAIVPAPPPAQAAERPTAPATAPAQTGGSLLDLNTVTAAQLEHLPGIGPALAARIIADRTKHGRYTSVDQLDRVEGIGPKTLEKLRPYLTVK